MGTKALQFDHTGQRFGRLVALRHAGYGRWECVCDCGNKKTIFGAFLRNGKVVSCRCRHAEGMSPKHGKSLTPEYATWVSMQQRCSNPKTTRYADYGGRGIAVCQRWKDSFESFLTDMGERPSSNHSIDRIDPNGDYEPSNCHWITKGAQQRNKRNNHYLTYNGETLLLIEWAERLGIKLETIRARLRYGWPIERVLCEPVDVRKHKTHT